MTWSPFFRLRTPGPTSTTTPAPSCPRMAGKSPSGSLPDSVYASVWQTPVALISTRTSPCLGPSTSTVSMVSGSPARRATAARAFMVANLLPARVSLLATVDLDLTETQLLVQKTARDFATRVVAPRAAEIDATEEFPRETLRGLADLVLLAINVAPELGGSGAGVV